MPDLVVSAPPATSSGSAGQHVGRTDVAEGPHDRFALAYLANLNPDFQVGNSAGL